MTNAERASELQRLRQQVQRGALRTELNARRDLLGRIVPLMNFNEVYHTNALQFADILSQAGFSSSLYDSCEGRLDVLMGQAVTELMHNLTPPPPQHSKHPKTHHSQSSIRWWAKNVLLPLIGTGGLVTLISIFVSNKEDHGKPRDGQQVTVTINLTDQLRANLAATPSRSPESGDAPVDRKAQVDALASLGSHSNATEFRLPDDAPAWLKIAVKELGQARGAGNENNPRILEYLRATHLPEEMTSTDKTPWCGAFISWVYQQAAIAAPKTGTVASFQSWGRRIDQAALGALVLINWSPTEQVRSPHHAGFVLMDLGDTVLIVAGNTLNAVRVQAVDKRYVVEYPLPLKA